MVKAKDGTDSVESFEMEVAEEEEEEEEDSDDDDEVFVKKGRHGSENGSAKKPLIKGDFWIGFHWGQEMNHCIVSIPGEILAIYFFNKGGESC